MGNGASCNHAGSLLPLGFFDNDPGSLAVAYTFHGVIVACTDAEVNALRGARVRILQSFGCARQEGDLDD